METYKKDFVGWAKVAKRIEASNKPKTPKIGAIYWCNFGVGIGHELAGKDVDFSRPCLILAHYSNSLVLAIPLTSRKHTGSNYEPNIANGKTENLVLSQARPLDIRRIGDFMDEIDKTALTELRKRYLRFVKYQLYKKDDPSQ